jgi:signal transduction histidine kinase
MKSLSLRARFILASVTIIVLTTAAMSLLSLTYFRSSLEEEIAKRAATMAEQLGNSAQLALRTGNHEQLDRLAADALVVEDVVMVEFIDPSGTTLARVERKGAPAGRTVERQAAVTRENVSFADELELLTGHGQGTGREVLGRVRVRMELGSADRMIAQARMVIVLLAAALSVLAIFFSVHLSGRMTRSLARLAEGVEKIRAGSLDVEIKVDEESEIGDLADHFNRMARDLSKTIDQMVQQEKMATLGRMASAISHELGSPLNSIMFDAAMIADEAKEQAVRDCAASITEQTRRMRETIKNLLDFARPAAATPEPVDLAAVLEEAKRVLAHPIRAEAFNIVSDLGPGTLQALGIRNLIVQVFVNLIKNAIEAAGREGKLNITIRETGRHGAAERGIEVQFQDSGPGVPPQILPLIFEPFYTTKQEGEGTGLGLAICRQIMRSIGGDIRAEPGAEGGAIFTLFFKPTQ